MPAPLFNTAPTQQKIILRLIYHTLSSAPPTHIDVFKLEVDLPKPGAGELRRTAKTWTTLDATSAAFSHGQTQNNEDTVALFDYKLPTATAVGGTLLKSRCWQGHEMSVDIMMPDRFFNSCFAPLMSHHFIQPNGHTPLCF